MTHNPFEEINLDTARSTANEETFERNYSDRGDEAVEPKHAPQLQENDRNNAEVTFEENELDENKGGFLELEGSEGESESTKAESVVEPKHALQLQDNDDQSNAEVTFEENELDENQGGSLELSYERQTNHSA